MQLCLQNYIYTMKIRNFKQLPGSSWNQQHNNQFIETKFQKNAELLDVQRLNKKQKILKRLPKKLTNKNFYCKTETGDRYGLPQINLTKNLLIDIKPNQQQRSEKLIRNSSKNTKILNQMIQILRDGACRAENYQQNRSSKLGRKKTILTQTSSNQFMNNNVKNQISSFHRGPKIIHPEFSKFCDHNNIVFRRKIFSEERARPQGKKPMIIKNNSPQQDPHTLTFYKPIKNFPKSNTQSISNVIKDINADFCVEI